MRPSTTSTTGVSASPPVPVDTYVASTELGIVCRVTGGAATYTIQQTRDNVFDASITPIWESVGDAALVGAVADAQGTVQEPVSAVRINQTVGVGTVTMRVLQVAHPAT